MTKNHSRVKWWCYYVTTIIIIIIIIIIISSEKKKQPAMLSVKTVLVVELLSTTLKSFRLIPWNLALSKKSKKAKVRLKKRKMREAVTW